MKPATHYSDLFIICNNASHFGPRFMQGASMVWETDIRTCIESFGRDLPTGSSDVSFPDAPARIISPTHRHGRDSGRRVRARVLPVWR